MVWSDRRQSVAAQLRRHVSVDDALLDRIEETCRRASEGRRARAVLERSAPQGVFTGFIGSYGKVIGAPSLVAFVGADDSLADVGYVGESVILDATLAGLDTCWIAASFSAENVGASWTSRRANASAR